MSNRTCLILAALMTLATSTHHSDAAAAPASAPSTREKVPLALEIHEAVESAQQWLRAPVGIPVKLTRGVPEVVTTKPADPMPRLASGLVGLSGPIAFHVYQVTSNEGLTIFLGAPPSMYALRGKSTYLVIGELENPTPLYTNTTQPIPRQSIRKRPTTIPATAQAPTAEPKPIHALWILSDDPAVARWPQGGRFMIHSKVLDAVLTPVGTNYVKATIVLQMEQPPATQPAATRPAK